MLQYKQWNKKSQVFDIFTVYTKEEADSLGISYKDLVYCDAGDWCITTDGYVCQVIRRVVYPDTSHYHHRNTTVWYFGFGYHLSRVYYYPDGRPKPILFKLTGIYIRDIDGIPRLGRHKKRDALSNRKRRIASYLALFGSLEVALYEEYGHLHERLRIKWRRIVERDKEFKEMLREEVSKLLENQGLGKEKVAEWLKEAFEVARNRRSPLAMVQAVKLLSDLHGFNDKQVQSNALLSSMELERALLNAGNEVFPSAEVVNE